MRLQISLFSFFTFAALLATAMPASALTNVRDPYYPTVCKQNSANPASAYDCTNDAQDVSWSMDGNPQIGGNGPEAVRDRAIQAYNEYQASLGPVSSYYIRARANPDIPCQVKYTNNAYSSPPDLTKINFFSFCRYETIDIRFDPPAVVSTSNGVATHSVTQCGGGWYPSGSVAPNYTSYPAVCIKDTSTKEAGECEDCKRRIAGNPITIAVGNKYQREADYVGTGAMPLQLVRHYNSTGTKQTTQIGAHWNFHYDRTVTSDGRNSAQVTRADGKMYFYYLTAGGVWSNEDDVNDRLTALASGGWKYYVGRSEEVETYDANGRLTGITSRSGEVTTLTYSDAGTSAAIAPGPNYLILVTDNFGRSLQLTYSADGRVATILDPSGAAYQYGYDANGNLTSVTKPDSSVRTYVYNEAAYNASTFTPWALTGIIDENNVRFATYQYNSSGRATSTEHAGGVNKFTVSAANPYSVVDPTGTSRSILMTGAWGVKYPFNVTQPCSTPGCSGNVTSNTSYDANGNVASRTDYNGNRTAYVFDLARNLETSRTEAQASNGGNTLQTRTITTTWHPTFRLPASVTEPTAVGNRVTTFGRDGHGNVLSKSVAVAGVTRTWSWTYDTYGRVLTSTDPLNNNSVNTYYPNDASQGSKRGMLYTVTNAAGHTTTITDYNAHGQPLTVVDPNGLVTDLVYDARQRLKSRSVGGETTVYDYDGVGQLKKVTLPDNSYLTYHYDGAHRLDEIKDGLGNRVVYSLDNMGNRFKEEYADPANLLTRTRSRVYDALNRLQKDIGGETPATQVTQYGYDNNGNQTSTLDPLMRTTSQTYDALNRLKQVVDPFNGAAAPTKYEYDAQDNLTKVTDPKNLSTVYGYNGFNELESQASPDTGSTSFTYDAAGNLKTKTDARGVQVLYSYDILNRVQTISFPAYQTDPAETVTYTYDSCGNGKGRLCSITDKTGSTAYSYDNHGRLISKAQTTLGFTQTVSYGYNNAGQMDRMTLPSGNVVTYNYLNNRITGITHDGETIVKNADYEPFGPIGEWTWGNDTVASPNKHTRFFDLDGRIGRIESGNGIDPSLIVYDAASRITALQKMTGASIDPAKSTTYGYDSLDRLNAVTPNAGNPNPTRGLTYDGVGNRLTSTVAGNTTNYGYGTSNHRLNNLTGAITKSYSYDADGNRTGDGTAAWNYGGNNRPTVITTAGTSVQAGINALGQRVTKTVNGTVIRFVYDEGGHLIGEYDVAGKALQETLWFNDLPVAVIK